MLSYGDRRYRPDRHSRFFKGDHYTECKLDGSLQPAMMITDATLLCSSCRRGWSGLAIRRMLVSGTDFRFNELAKSPPRSQCPLVNLG